MLVYAPTRIRSPSAKLTTPAGWLLAYRLNLALIRETSTRPTATAGCLSTSPRARAYDETGEDDKRKYTVAHGRGCFYEVKGT